MNPWLLTKVLREEWKFDGFVTSDWSGAYDQVAAIASGNDLAMPGPRGIQCIVKAVEEGRLKEEQLDICIRRFLKILLQAPVMTKKDITFDMKETIEATAFAAREGITLLKNKGVLPLSKDTKVTFYGKRTKAFAGSGSGSAQVETSLITNPYDSTVALIGKENVTFEHPDADTKIMIVTAGANGQEGSDRLNMDMDEDDKEALEQAIADARTNDGKVILMLNTAGPVSLMDYEPELDAVICAYYPGMQGGKVLADVLFGDVNPSGKLPMTYPKYYRDCPSYKNFPGENKEVWYGEGIYVGYRYYDAKQIEPLYPFGFGLSYTTFELTEMQAPEKADIENGDVAVTVKVKNTGERAGSEVVQVYVHEVISRMDKPVKELKGFQKVYLEAGEEREVQITLKKEDFAGYSTELGKWVNEPGEYDILVGTSSADICFSKRITILCRNAFCFNESTSIGEIAANAQAVKLINEVIEEDIIKAADNALVFTPGQTWKEVWGNLVVPVLEERKIIRSEIDEMYQIILKGFGELH